MRLKVKVKQVQKVNDQKLLVNLSSDHAHVAIDLPVNHESHINVGDDWILQSAVHPVGFAGEVDDVAEAEKMGRRAFLSLPHPNVAPTETEPQTMPETGLRKPRGEII